MSVKYRHLLKAESLLFYVPSRLRMSVLVTRKLTNGTSISSREYLSKIVIQIILTLCSK